MQRSIIVDGPTLVLIHSFVDGKSELRCLLSFLQSSSLQYNKAAFPMKNGLVSRKVLQQLASYGPHRCSYGRGPIGPRWNSSLG